METIEINVQQTVEEITVNVSMGASTIAEMEGLQAALNAKVNSPVTIGGVTGLQTALDGKVNSPVTIGAVTGLQTALDGKVNSPVTIGAVTGLQTALDGKVNSPVTIGAVTGLQTALDGKVNSPVTIGAVSGLQDALNSKAPNWTITSAKVIESDMYNTTPFGEGLIGTSILSGIAAAGYGELNHPGVFRIADGNNANGGYYIKTGAASILISGGEKSIIIAKIVNSRTTANGWLGFCDNITNADPIDGCYFKWIGDGTNATVYAVNRSGSVETINATTFTAVLNTWYTFVIEVNSDASSVNFKILSETGVELYNVNITTNIPKTAGTETSFCCIACESTNNASELLMHIDYMRMEINRTLVR